MYFTDFLIKGASPSHNKAYALHSLAVVRATPNRGYKAAATSHKQNVIGNAAQEGDINDKTIFNGPRK